MVFSEYQNNDGIVFPFLKAQETLLNIVKFFIFRVLGFD